MINVLTRKSLNRTNGTTKSVSFEFISDYSAGYRILEKKDVMAKLKPKEPEVKPEINAKHLGLLLTKNKKE
jgi:hypothetical protein